MSSSVFFSCVMDQGPVFANTRLRVELGYQPAFDAVSAAREFARAA